MNRQMTDCIKIIAKSNHITEAYLNQPITSNHPASLLSASLSCGQIRPFPSRLPLFFFPSSFLPHKLLLFHPPSSFPIFILFSFLFLVSSSSFFHSSHFTVYLLPPFLLIPVSCSLQCTRSTWDTLPCSVHQQFSVFFFFSFFLILFSSLSYYRVEKTRISSRLSI